MDFLKKLFGMGKQEETPKTDVSEETTETPVSEEMPSTEEDSTEEEAQQ